MSSASCKTADSFGQKLTNTLDRLGSQSPQGAITLALAANANQEKTLNNNITTQDALIATDQAKYHCGTDRRQSDSSVDSRSS